jgi:hypothetical protein
MTSVNVPEKMNSNYWVRPTTAATAPAVIVNPREAAMVCLDTASEPAYVSRTFVLEPVGPRGGFCVLDLGGRTYVTNQSFI